MNYSNNKVSDIQIAYIGGGSRGWAWTFMTDLALDDQISGTIRLYDIDRQAAENNAVIGNHLMSREDAKGDWKFEVKDSLQDVLAGCDFVVISILQVPLMKWRPMFIFPTPRHLSVCRRYRRPRRHDPCPAHHSHVC